MKSAWHWENGIMVFTPTTGQYENFTEFISYMESVGAHKQGVAKIIPPVSFRPRKNGYANLDFQMPFPLYQLISGSQGVYQMYNIQKKATKFSAFEKLSKREGYRAPSTTDIDELERKYWKNITYNPAIYGADIAGTLFDLDMKNWNINNLDSILQTIPKETGIEIPGVHTAYLYVGMWKSSFGWHTEDMDLYSINYHHFGAPKLWYAISPENAFRLETLARSFFPEHYRQCPAFLRHKMTIISPSILKKYSVPFVRAIQRKGQIMISFPHAYHSGFNLGMNCAESTNFATLRWIDFGKKSVRCYCHPDTVQIDMGIFVKKYQPDQYQKFLTQKKKLNIDKKRGKTAKNSNSVKILENKNSDRLENELDTLSDKDIIQEEKMSPICKHFSGLWRSQSSENFTFEAAFNLVLSQKGSRCAVCALFEDPSPFVSFEREELLTTYWALKLNRVGCLPLSTDKITENVQIDSSSLSDNFILELNSVNSEKDEELESVYQLNDTSPIVDSSNTNIKKNRDVNITDNQNGSDSMKLSSSTFNGVDIERILSQEITNVLSKERDVSSCSSFDLTSNFDSSSITDSTAATNCSPLNENNLSETSPVFSPLDQIVPDSFQIKNSSNLDCAECMDIDLINLNDGVCIAEETIFATNNGLFNENIFLLRKRAQILDSETGEKKQCLNENNKNIHTYTKSTVNFSKSSYSQKISSKDNSPMQNSPTKCSFNEATNLNKISKNMTFTKISKQNSHTKDNCINKNSSNSSKKKIEKDFKVTENITTQMIDTKKSKKQNNKLYHDNNIKSENTPLEQTLIKTKNTKNKNNNNENNANNNSNNSKNKKNKKISINSSDVFKNEEIDSYASSKDNFDEAVCGEIKLESINDNEDSEDEEIIQCMQCRVAVHPSCYGLDLADVSTNWVCSRCLSKATNVQCELCHLRGGPLKPTTNNKWAHLTCAIVIPEVLFGDPDKREPIDLSKLSKARSKLKCLYCKDHEIKGAASLQCSYQKCPLSFHITCAQYNGIVHWAPDNDGDKGIRANCLKHDKDKQVELRKELSVLEVEDKVIAKINGSRFSYAVISNKSEQPCFEVEFIEDESICFNVPQGDIIGESKEINAKVKVKWNDSQMYDGIIRAENKEWIYKIVFEDGTIKNLPRDDVFSMNDKIPKKVLCKLEPKSL